MPTVGVGSTQPGLPSGASPRTFRAVVTELHLQTYESFVAHFERTARELSEETGESALRTVTVSRRQLDRWLSGDVKSLPRPRQCRVLERLLGVKAQELFASSPSAVPVVGSPGATDDRTRLRSAAEQAAQLLAVLEPSSLGAFSLDELETNARSLVRQATQKRQVDVLAPLMTMQAVVSTHLNLCGYPDQLTRLYRVAAVVNSVLAKMAHDRGDMDSSSTFARTALFAAERAEDRFLQAWSSSLQSLAAFWAGDYSASVRYADAGLRVDRGETATTVWLYGLKARALAYSGRSEQATDCLDRAVAIRNQLDDPEPGEEEAQLSSFLTHAEELQIAYEARTRVLLAPHAAETWAVAHECFRLFEHAGTGDASWAAGAGSRCTLAELHLRNQQFDEALPLMLPVLTAPVSQARAVARSVRQFDVVLRAEQDHSPEANALATEVTGFWNRLHQDEALREIASH